MIEIQIEELVLEGFSPFDRYRIGEAVQRELTRLVSGPELAREFRHDVAIESVDAGAIQMQANARGEFTGAQIAQAVYSSLSL